RGMALLLFEAFMGSTRWRSRCRRAKGRARHFLLRRRNRRCFGCDWIAITRRWQQFPPLIISAGGCESIRARLRKLFGAASRAAVRGAIRDKLSASYQKRRPGYKTARRQWDQR